MASYGVLGALGGAGLGIARTAEMGIRADYQAERDARINEYKIQAEGRAEAREIAREGRAEARAFRVEGRAEQRAKDAETRAEERAIAADARRHKFALGEIGARGAQTRSEIDARGARDQQLLDYKQSMAEQSALRERERRKGLISASMGEGEDFSSKAAIEAAIRAGDTALAAELREIEKVANTRSYLDPAIMARKDVLMQELKSLDSDFPSDEETVRKEEILNELKSMFPGTGVVSPLAARPPTQGGDFASTPVSDQPALPPAARAKLKAGKVITFANGQKWTLDRNGNPLLLNP